MHSVVFKEEHLFLAKTMIYFGFAQTKTTYLIKNKIKSKEFN